MDFFNRQDDVLYAEQCSVKDLAAKYQTPLYVYSRATIERHWHAFDQAAAATEHLICYAVKSQLQYCHSKCVSSFRKRF